MQMPPPSAPPESEVDTRLPAQCDGLSGSQIDKAKSLAIRNNKTLEETCSEISKQLAQQVGDKRPRSGGRRKTRRARKNKKRQQKKSRKNYK